MSEKKEKLSSPIGIALPSSFTLEEVIEAAGKEIKRHLDQFVIMAVQESGRGEISKPNGDVIPGVAYLVYFKAAGKVEYEHPEFDAITGSVSQGEEEPKIPKFVVTDLEPEERPLPDLDNLN